MNKKIVLGSLLAVVLMISLPAIPALEYHQASEACTTYVFETLEKSLVGDDGQTSFNLQGIEKEQSQLEKLQQRLVDDGPQPQCIILILTLLRFIVRTLIKIITNIVQFIRNVVNLAELIIYLVQQLSYLIELIQQFIELIQDLLNPQPSIG
jgi:hypothetical protein